MRWGIRTQVLVPLGLTLAGVTAATSYAAYAAAGRARAEAAGRLRAAAATLRDAPFPLTAAVLRTLHGLTGAEFVAAGPDGKVTTTLPGADPAALPPPSDGPDDPAVAVGGTVYRCHAVRLPPAHPEAGGVLYALDPEPRLRREVGAAAVPALVLGVAVGVTSVLVMAWVADGLVRRVAELGRQTRRVAAGDFAPVPLPDRRDELRDLAADVNDMAARLERLQEAMGGAERLRLLGQVSGGLAHQLRNGVTGARLAVQLHARDCPGGRREALAVAVRQLDLVESTLRKFLDLGRADEPRRERCDLRALVDEACALLAPQCRHAGTALAWDRPADAHMIDADPGQVGQLLVNVIGNAVEAAGPGGDVAVTLTAAGGSHTLTVSDSGPGPPAAVAGRLFEPFATGKPGGVGLGLAAARGVAARHGGTVTWHRDGGRTYFVVTLPAA